MAIPVYVKHMISFKENTSSGRFDVTIGPKQNMGKTVEGVVMTVHMPKAVLNMNLTATQGSYTFDPVTKVSLKFFIYLNIKDGITTSHPYFRILEQCSTFGRKFCLA